LFGVKEATMNQARIREQVEAAALEGDLQRFMRLVETHGPAAVLLDDDPEELTSLHYASSFGSTPVVDYLLSAAVGADPCAARGNAFTPLHAAAMNGHTAACDALLSKGAKVNAQTDPQGYSPLHSAAFAGHLDTVLLLLRAGADPGLKNYRGETPADTAKRTGQTEVAQRLNRHA